MSPDRPTEVAEGVYRCGSRRVNWYLLAEGGDLTVVDAGLPAHWQQFRDAIASLDYRIDDVQAIVLTHGHPDHVGFADRLREAADVPVLIHEADAAMARGNGGGAPLGPVIRNLWRPAMLALLVELGRGGGLSIDPVETVQPFEDGDRLDVPGTPRAIHVPGHSAGSCALAVPDRDALLCGDALATLNIATGARGDPRLMPLFNADLAQARRSLDAIASVGEVTLLPGHGDPWRGEMDAAVRGARAR